MQRGDIGWAHNQLMQHRRVTRCGWNGKGMYIEMQRPDKHSKMTLPYVFMHTAQGHKVPWICSQGDFFATDWDIFTEKEAERVDV